MVTQESVLFNDSVYNNVWMGKTEASEEEVIQAAKIANAHQLIENLPEKYQTNIGDDGNKLSGGQKQRISIARAVLKNPPIMILDEATSALDTESERLVQDALDHMMEKQNFYRDCAQTFDDSKSRSHRSNGTRKHCRTRHS